MTAQLERDIDDEYRLSYLSYYCKNEAKETIENCSILEPEEEYQGALRIRQRRFRKSHMIIRANLDNLVNVQLLGEWTPRCS